MHDDNETAGGRRHGCVLMACAIQWRSARTLESIGSFFAHSHLLPRQESFASLHILTRRASEGSEALPSLARRVRMSFFGARVILAFSRGSMSSSKTNRPWPADEPASPAGPPAVKIVTFSQSSREGS